MSLSILYVAIARRLGWQADVLNTPSHVLVRVGPADSTAMIDPFHGGALVEADDYAALLDRAVGPGGGMRAYDIAPMSDNPGSAVAQPGYARGTSRRYCTRIHPV